MDLTDIAMYCKIKKSEQDLKEYKQQANLYESVLTGKVTEFVIPDRWTVIKRGAFADCLKLINVTISDNIETIGASAFYNCTNLKNIEIPNSVTIIHYRVFHNCASLTDIIIPSSIISLGVDVFTNCSKLTNVTLGDGFNCNGLNLSPSTKYSVDTLVAMLTALADRTGQTAYTLTLGTTNLAKLSDAQKAIATDKNWTLA